MRRFKPFERRCRLSQRGGVSWLSSLLLVLLIAVHPQPKASALEAKWTPNENDDGPLPLSMKQRQQLMQLDDIIRSSPNPEQTLQQIAASNEMPPDELLGLLQRNRRDMEAGGHAVQPPPLARRTNIVVRLVTSIFVLLANAATKHPRAFLLSLLALIALGMTIISAPTTGMVISSRPLPFLSKGPTTVWAPPSIYLQELLNVGTEQADTSLSVSLEDWTEELASLLFASDDDQGAVGSFWLEPESPSSTLQGVATAQSSINVADFLTSAMSNDDDVNDETKNELMHMILEQALKLLLVTRDITEFVEPSNSIRLVTSSTTTTANDSPASMLVVAGMGDWQRFGLQPLQITDQQDTYTENSNDEEESSQETGDDDTIVISVTFSTLSGGHFDGHLQVAVERRQDDDTDNVMVRTSLVFPKRGRQLGKKLALRMVQAINHSLELSLRTRLRQSLARRSQSSNFQGKAREKALRRRHLRFYKEKAMEEMAADRRRRWQRKNPSAGSYRPSGERMRSPNNAIYK